MGPCCIQVQMSHFEKFPAHELNMLREELMQSGLDTFQAADLISGFLAQHGYGVSASEARIATTNSEIVRCTLPRLQEELEKLAQVM